MMCPNRHSKNFSWLFLMINDIHPSLPTWYSKPVRFYHTLEHSKQVALLAHNLSTSIPETEQNRFFLWNAALWHDAVYVPGSETNEAESAVALTATIPGMEYAASLIRQTTVVHHASNEVYSDMTLNCLLDADLGPLSASYQAFKQNQANIMLELDIKAGDAWKVAEFLDTHFAAKKTIYRTPKGQHMMEKHARKNIARFVLDFPPLQ